MHSWKTYLRDRPRTAWMLFFVLAFYALALWAEVLSEDGGSSARQDGRLSTAELRQREAVFAQNLQKNPGLVRAFSLSFLFLLGAGLALDLHALTAKRAGRPFWGSRPGEAGAPWGLGGVFEFFVLLFFIETALTGTEIVAGVFIRWDGPQKDFLLVANSFVRDVLVAVLVIFAVKKKFCLPLSRLGLTAKDWGLNIFRGLAGYLAVIPWLVLILAASAAAARFFSYEPEPQEIVQIYLAESARRYFLFFTLFVTVVGPVAEEIFFRGFVYGAFRKKFGTVAGALAAASLFSAMHMSLVAFLPILCLGLFLIYLYEKTGSLVPSITAHIAHNLAMVAFTMSFKWLSV
ncbi:MAG: CPBP family intramembrane metalloprotease [Candidatus Omnitrophica bacterium]|nr:CPBP family intramembrane metalloprotease [Candidatus Omnitrophota bacterium]